MFEPDGRHFRTAFGKDYIDNLLAQCEEGMIRISLDFDVRQDQAENRLAAVEGHVAILRRDLTASDGRVDVVVARAAEDGDAVINDR